MYASSEIYYSKLKITRTNKSALSLGLVLPFNPCMQNEKTIKYILGDSEKRVQIMLNGTSDQAYTNNIFVRLQKILSKLNYNSHCRSIAVLITPYEEKVIYLNFLVKPVIYLNKYLSLLELTANADRQPDFYYLDLQQNHAKLYEYHHKQLHKVYATKQDSGLNEKNNPETLFKQVSQTITRINGNNETPVFITGNTDLVELYYNSSYYSSIFFSLLDKVAPLGEEIMNRHVKEIISQWNYWRSKFIIERIILTQKSTVLIAGLDAVLKALHHSVDGLLLIDKSLNQQLYKSLRTNTLFNSADELMNQVECFLKRGSRIEITETGLLKEFGDAVLLQRKPSHFFEISPVKRINKYLESNLF